jgi:Polyketide cyclase / dehydrase and lipid transport
VTGAEYVLTGQLTVPLPASAAYRLFTPEGERTWVDGWDPRYPVPAGDDPAPGTVFVTAAHGATTTWIVLEREPGRRIRYARVTPGARAGTVAVVLEDTAEGCSVTVTYELTALSEAGRDGLREFAGGYPAFLRSWQEAIAASLSA